MHKGLVCAYVLDGKGSGRALTWREVKAWQPEQGLLWVHLDYVAPSAQRWLKKESGLDPVTAESMLVDESRPRVVVSPEHLLVFMRGVNTNPGADPEDMVSIRLWFDRHRIITTRKRRLLSVEDLRATIVDGQGPKTSTEFLIQLSERLLNRIADVIDDLERQSDELEEQMVTEESFRLRPRIAEIRRAAVSIRRYLAPQREALNRLYVEKHPLFTRLDQMLMREITDHTIRYIEDLDSVRDRTAITQEELASRLSEQVDKRMYMLAVVAVLFLPITFITGLLGINVGGIPGANNSSAFLVVCVLLFILAIVVWLFLRWKKWV